MSPVVLVAAALAATPAGFATPGALPTNAAALQVGALFDAERAYGQARVELAGHWRAIGLDVELSGLAGSGTAGWSDEGLGSMRVGVRGFFGSPTFRNALGIDLRTSFADTPTVSFWVFRSTDARSSLVPRITWDMTTGPEASPFSLRLALGYGIGYVGDDLTQFSGTGLDLTKLFAVGDHWAVLTEATLAIDGTPFELRAGARYRPDPHWTVDALVQLPVDLMLVHPVFLPAVQVRGEL